jgi:deoxyribodipyrimidine photo-lyase
MIAFWFRRDLRLHDNAGLYHALKAAQKLGEKVLPLFIFDRVILDLLADKRDRRVEFIHQSLAEMQAELVVRGSSLVVRYGSPEDVWKQLLQEFQISQVFTNHDFEPYAAERDSLVKALLNANGATFNTFKDHVIFEKSEILTAENRPYTVFTPYSKKWKSLVNDFYLQSYPTHKYLSALWESAPLAIPSLGEMSFEPVGEPFPSKTVRDELVQNYNQTRDFPAVQGTTRLSVHLRFGTVSIRALARTAARLNETWLNELIWRDFYQQILWHFPRVAYSAFKPAYDAIPWRDVNTDERAVADFAAWQEGRTGYPIVDAGMRELNATGFMHNRVRMITASFLTKHLLVDWRLGEAYFAAKLLDFDLAANNGGWQWAAGTGCDAAPYFRIFNPTSQTEKFDKNFAYIRHWVPELATLAYPAPIVEHAYARQRALATYKSALKGEDNDGENKQ